MNGIGQVLGEELVVECLQAHVHDLNGGLVDVAHLRVLGQKVLDARLEGVGFAGERLGCGAGRLERGLHGCTSVSLRVLSIYII